MPLSPLDSSVFFFSFFALLSVLVVWNRMSWTHSVVIDIAIVCINDIFSIYIFLFLVFRLVVSVSVAKYSILHHLLQRIMILCHTPTTVTWVMRLLSNCSWMSLCWRGCAILMCKYYECKMRNKKYNNWLQFHSENKSEMTFLFSPVFFSYRPNFPLDSLAH